MGNFINKISLSSRGLRPKLKIAFALMSVIPLLICFNYIFPSFFSGFFLIKTTISLIFIVAFSVLFAALGFIIAKEMVDQFLRISTDARIIASGNLNHKITIEREDEIGDLGNSLSELTHRIQSNMEELQSYSEKTREINQEVNKRVIALSNLLHISNLISQGGAISEILEIVLEKIIQIGDSNLGF